MSGQGDGMSVLEREVIAWARRAGVPLMSPPRVPEAAQAMCMEIERLRQALEAIRDSGWAGNWSSNVAATALRESRGRGA